MPGNVPTISELIVEGFSDGGCRSEHALAVTMADASPVLLAGCKTAVIFIQNLPSTPEVIALVAQLTSAVDAATIPVVRNAS